MAEKLDLVQGKYLVGMNSVVGDTRRQYEDRAKVQQIRTAGGLDLLVAIVADGVGSADNGSLAAQMSIDSVTTFFEQSDETDIPHLVVNAIKFANHVVFKDVLTRNVDASTTLVVGVIYKDRFYVGNVGDSRAYWIQESGKIVQLTLDHSYYNLKGGDPNSPTAEMLINAIGIQKDVFVDIGFYIQGSDRKVATKIGLAGMPLKLGETILLCSDGLIKTNARDERFVTDAEIVEALRTEIQPNAAAVRMTSFAEGRYVDDNVSVVTIQYTSPKLVENVLHKETRQKQVRQLRYVGLAVLLVGAIIGGIFAIRALTKAEGRITALQSQPTATAIVWTPTPQPTATPVVAVAKGQTRVDYLIAFQDGSYVETTGSSAEDPTITLSGQAGQAAVVNSLYASDMQVDTRSIGAMLSVASAYTDANNNQVFVYPDTTVDVKYTNMLDLGLERGSVYISLAQGGLDRARISFPTLGDAVAELSGSRMLLNIIGGDIELWCLEGDCRMEMAKDINRTAANQRQLYKPDSSSFEGETEIIWPLYETIWDWNVKCGLCMPMEIVPHPTPTPTPTRLPESEQPTKTPLFFKNTDPSMSISSPASGTTVMEGTTITFSASAYDEEDKELTSRIAWTEGATLLSTGGTFSKSDLTPGTHTITASVTDSDGASARRSVTITVTKKPNETPTISITSPGNGASFVDGTSITFSANASDKEDGDLSKDIQWSDNGGSLGTGASFSQTLKVGTHTITASITDSGGGSASASVSITVTEKSNTTPKITIDSPTNGSSFEEGKQVTFKASATDSEDGDLKASIIWYESSSQLGTGDRYSTTTLSVSIHTITASVADSKGASASASISITITAIPTEPPNRAPVAIDGSASFNVPSQCSPGISISLSASDPDGDPLTWFIESGPSSGDLENFDGGKPTFYDPDCQNNQSVTSDSFTFYVQDDKGATSNTATFTITWSHTRSDGSISFACTINFGRQENPGSITVDPFPISGLNIKLMD